MHYFSLTFASAACWIFYNSWSTCANQHLLQCWHLCAVAVWISMTATAMITMAFVYTGRLQYCANDIDRVAFVQLNKLSEPVNKPTTLKLMICVQKQTMCSDSSLLDNDAFITYHFNLRPLDCTFWGNGKEMALAVLISTFAFLLRIWKSPFRFLAVNWSRWFYCAAVQCNQGFQGKILLKIDVWSHFSYPVVSYYLTRRYTR
jgi:hypothetical protein